MSGRADIVAIVLAADGREPVIAGLTPSERARRVVERAGISAARVRVVRTTGELAAISLGDAARVLVVRGRRQLVSATLLEPLHLDAPGARVALAGDGVDAGALLVGRDQAGPVLAALGRSLECDLAVVGGAAGADPITVDERARHPAGTPAEVRAARAWQWQVVHKPLDAFLTRRFWRPVARPLTALALRLPFTPNMISVACIATSIAGGVIAAGAGWSQHVLGLAICFFASALDNVDGEVARLRLQASRLGGWLDTIGDDVARFALIGGIFVHVAGEHPGWPVLEAGAATVALTALSCGLLYWWCVFVGKTPNNQEYAAVLGAAPHARGRAGWRQRVADLGAAAARRDFIDLGVVALGVLGLSELSALGLAVGSIVGTAVIVPNHLRIVRARRAARLPASAELARG